MEVERRLAWREGMISFDGDSLAQAAAQFARYSDTHIVIADPAIGRLSVVGLYSATNPIGFARAVALSMNLRVELHGETVRLLASR
jgi:transmembrane sensor